MTRLETRQVYDARDIYTRWCQRPRTSRIFKFGSPAIMTNDVDASRRSGRKTNSRYGRGNLHQQVPSAVHYVGYVEEDETPEMIMAKFAELDADSSGTLSLPEFARASAAIGLRTRGGIPFTPESARAHFKAMDTDGSVSIDFDEFAVWAVRYQVCVRLSLPLISAQQI